MFKLELPWTKQNLWSPHSLWASVGPELRYPVEKQEYTLKFEISARMD